MSKRRIALMSVLFVAAVTGLVFYLAWLPDRAIGAWTGTATPYKGVAPGNLGLEIATDGVVLAAPVPGVWWADGQHELRRRGEKVEIRMGKKVVAELILKPSPIRLKVLDTACPTGALVFYRDE